VKIEHRRRFLSKRINWIVIFFVVSQLIFQLLTLNRGVEYITTQLTIDDTYYFLETAWRSKDAGFVTFDGIHKTNGIQLLWFVILYLTALVVPTKTALLYMSIIFNFFLNSASYFVILKLHEKHVLPGLTAIMIGFWSLICFSSATYSMGM